MQPQNGVNDEGRRASTSLGTPPWFALQQTSQTNALMFLRKFLFVDFKTIGDGIPIFSLQSRVAKVSYVTNYLWNGFVQSSACGFAHKKVYIYIYRSYRTCHSCSLIISDIQQKQVRLQSRARHRMARQAAAQRSRDTNSEWIWGDMNRLHNPRQTSRRYCSWQRWATVWICAERSVH